VANRRKKRDTRRNRRDRKGEPPKRKVLLPPSPGRLNLARGTNPGLPEASEGDRGKGSAPPPAGLSAEPPGKALGDLGYVRKDLVRILSLAGLMLLILIVTALALG